MNKTTHYCTALHAQLSCPACLGVTKLEARNYYHEKRAGWLKNLMFFRSVNAKPHLKRLQLVMTTYRNIAEIGN